jgi:hypothetical protein
MNIRRREGAEKHAIYNNGRGMEKKENGLQRILIN